MTARAASAVLPDLKPGYRPPRYEERPRRQHWDPEEQLARALHQRQGQRVFRRYAEGAADQEKGAFLRAEPSRDDERGAACRLAETLQDEAVDEAERVPHQLQRQPNLAGTGDPGEAVEGEARGEAQRRATERGQGRVEPSHPAQPPPLQASGETGRPAVEAARQARVCQTS